ncbi:MAG TPA: glycoside hydrolase family 18 protein [Burkholderiaceae bacterium]
MTKHLKHAVLASFIAVALCASAQATPKHARTHAEADYKIVGYYLDRADPARHYGVEKLKGTKATHINFAFAAIKDGSVVLGNTLPEEQSKADLAALVKLKRHNPKLQVLVSIGGWAGSQEFSDVALTPEARAKFADSAVAFMKQYRLDGIDIDWEFPVHGGDEHNARRPEDKENYTWLFHALRDRLDQAGTKDKRHYLLTAAIGNNLQFLADTEMDKVDQVLDWANIMTYDFSGHWNGYAGHHAPLYDDPMIRHAGVDGGQLNIDFIVSATLKAGVPPAKLVLGVPFYGYSWKQCGPANNGQLQDCHGKGRGTWEDGVLDYSDIEANFAGQKGFVRYWNERALAPYLFNTDTGEFVSYDDPESLGHKIDYIKSHGLGGAMFWEFTGDRKGVLQNKLARGLLGK